MDISKVLAELSERGVQLNEEQQKVLDAALQIEFREAAEKVIAEKLSTDDEKKKVSESEKWAKRLFTMAEDFNSAFTMRKANRGRGERFESVLAIETTVGEFKLVLSRPVS